ncbi:hypothetical protein [Marinobacterium arenosum]|nr:hypothetical protein [Marinobacterium arenosum]
MFGVDAYTAETLLPSLVMVAAMSTVMVWAFFKIKKLINEDPKK